MTEARCERCGEPMPDGEDMFKFHGYSGGCPKPPLPRPASDREAIYKRAWDAYVDSSMPSGTSTFDCIKRVVDAVLDHPRSPQ